MSNSFDKESTANANNFSTRHNTYSNNNGIEKDLFSPSQMNNLN